MNIKSFEVHLPSIASRLKAIFRFDDSTGETPDRVAGIFATSVVIDDPSTIAKAQKTRSQMPSAPRDASRVAPVSCRPRQRAIGLLGGVAFGALITGLGIAALGIVGASPAQAFVCAGVAAGDAGGAGATDSGMASNVACGTNANATGAGGAGVGNTATGSGANASGNTDSFNTATGNSANASGNFDSSNTATGAGANASGDGGGNTASGQNANASGANGLNIATGSFANASGNGSFNIATGSFASASGIGSGNVAAGNNANANGNGSNNTASGNNANASGTNSGNVAIGNAATANGDNGFNVAIGSGATASGNSTALGGGAAAAQANSVAIGQGVTTTRANQVAIGTAANTYTLAGVASAASLAAQAGPTNFVTTDAAGNLATSNVNAGAVTGLQSSVASLQNQVASLTQYSVQSRAQAQRGIAAAAAEAPVLMPSAPASSDRTCGDPAPCATRRRAPARPSSHFRFGRRGGKPRPARRRQAAWSHATRNDRAICPPRRRPIAPRHEPNR